ncbi:armadillo-type protein [Calycina marina]|uniref:Armadillo-type protein n=1 Tax=Calycina marina TaxID=1763456 RepID=A0A9P8CDR3_9HELO|nr:armadillo-type protein [Calycina marina]
MNFKIEAPGEAAPLTPEQLYLALQKASSSQQQSIQVGSQQLQTWQTQPGYYSTLQNVYLNNSLPTEIRYMAIIQLKNGIDKYWRKSAMNGIKSDEKAQIRSALLDAGLREGDARLGLQNALLIAKVVRNDYPLEWPDVVLRLMDVLRAAKDSNQLVLRRCLLMVLQIVKELSTAKMRAAQTHLQGVTPELVFILHDIYTKKVKIWTEYLKGTGEDEGGAMDAMENSLLAIKTSRRLLISGYLYPNHDSHVRQIWEACENFLSDFLPIVTAYPPVLATPAKELVGKHALQLSKLHVNMAIVHPAAFALLPNSLNLVRSYWGLVNMYGDVYGDADQDFGAKDSKQESEEENKTPILERLGLQGLLLLRACMKAVFNKAPNFQYRDPDAKKEQQGAIVLLLTQLFTEELVHQMANVIVTKFFIFRQVDLEAWEEDEDEWEIREEGGSDTWEFEIRPCAEKLFMDLVLNFKTILVAPLLTFFESVAGSSQASVVTKDAVYTAMGLSAPVVFQSFDFDSFLTRTLINDVQQTGQGYKVLRRRIAILIGQWITVNVSEKNRILVYELYQHLLNKNDATNDQVVRVTAARQFKFVVDDFGFVAKDFLPYSPDIVAKLTALIQEVENSETKLVIMDTIRMVVVRLENRITPITDGIVSILPAVWETSGEEHLLKQSILTILTTIVCALKEDSQRYHRLVLPLIQRAVEPGSEMQVYLLEEALELWLEILQQSPTPATPELLRMAECVFPLLEIGSDTLRLVLSITDSYVLLAPELMLSDTIRLRTLSYMANLLGVSRRMLAGQVTMIVERLIRYAGALGGSLGVVHVAKDLHEVGYLEKIFQGLHNSWSVSQTSGPNRKDAKVDDVVRTDYFTILARIAVADPDILVSVMSSFGDLEQVWGWLSSEWFRHFDCMANIDRQKLSCLALTQMMKLPAPIPQLVLPKLQDYFAMWTQVVGELSDGSDVDGDNLIWLSSEGHDYESPEDIRRRLADWKDPVHTIHTLEFVKQNLAFIVAAAGGETVFRQEWLQNVDQDVLNGFQQLGVRRETD